MAMQAWRDVDGARPALGLILHKTGLSLYIGKRLYRVRWR